MKAGLDKASVNGHGAARPRHFLDLTEFESSVLRGILDDGAEMKRAGNAAPLAGKTLAMIFEKPSTRTRVSFEVAMRQLGGHAITLSDRDMQLGRGESIADTARVLSCYVDAIMIRTKDHGKLMEMAEHATVPVINGLTDRSHPCQIMADIMTFEERRGPIKGRTVAWSGDGNNVCTSWIHAAAHFDFEFRVGAPGDLRPDPEAIEWAKRRGGSIVLTEDAAEAVRGADAVVTDVWVSMHDSGPTAKRHNMLAPYRVDAKLMAHAAPGAIFMHCLPAHRGDEVIDEVIDGPQSAVWDEAENRLHAQKGILSWCLG